MNIGLDIPGETHAHVGQPNCATNARNVFRACAFWKSIGASSTSYDEKLRLPDFSQIDMKIICLADLICYADFYCIIDIAGQKIEQAFLHMEDLEKYYHNSSTFFLEVGYYLQSMVIFEGALKYIVGKGSLH